MTEDDLEKFSVVSAAAKVNMTAEQFKKELDKEV